MGIKSLLFEEIMLNLSKPKIFRNLLTHIEQGIMHFVFGFNDSYTLDPPADVPLTDTPGKLLSARTKTHNSGRIEWAETKFNFTEYERLKPIIDKITKK